MKLSPSPSFEKLSFERKVNDALKSIERILYIERHPRLAGDVDHTYGSKYALVDATTNAAVIAYMNVFDKMGLDGSVLKGIDKKKATTMRFEASRSCNFLKKVVVDVPMDRSYEEERKTNSTVFGNSESKRVSRVVHHVTEFHYKVDTSWSLSIFSGTDVENKQVLKSRTSSTNLITQSHDSPFPKHKEFRHQDLSLTWFLKQIDTEKLTAQFKVDTEDVETKTPLRNKDTTKALEFAISISNWSKAVNYMFMSEIARKMIKCHNPALPKPLDFPLDRLSLIHEEYPVFNPILPLMEEIHSDEEPSESENHGNSEELNSSLVAFQHPSQHDDDSKPLLGSSDMTKLLNEHMRTLNVALKAISKTCISEESDSALSRLEFGMVLLSNHISDNLCPNYIDSMKYVEAMIETQLISAVGKKLTDDDLDAFVRFHNARLLTPAPKPFSHAIRRPHHYPVGLLSIERADSGKDECIYSHCRVVNAGSMFNMPLNAATTLELDGDQILHGWLQNRFSGQIRRSHQLVARARQFSSFVLVIGTMSGPTTLEPKDAIIVQNKDEIFIPLLVNELSTATEFKDAIKSLSPKQQQFARAFRSMQLASSVFALCVIQIKPQLECLLGLPADALDKEMKLTQDLMELFIEYQVPSDLLSYNGVDNAANEDKISNVRQNVKAVMDVIDGEKEKQLQEAKLKTDMAIEGALRRGLSGDEFSSCDEALRCADDRSMRSYDHSMCSYDRSVGGPTAIRDGSSRPDFRVGSSARRLKASPMKMSKAARPTTTMLMSAPPPMAMDMDTAEFESRQGTVQMKAEASHQHVKPMESNADTSQAKITPTEIKDSVTDLQGGVDQSHSVDFTLVPKILDAVVEKSGKDTALRSTVLKTSHTWVRNRQENILTASKQQTLDSNDIKKEKNKAFDLLDALSRSGSLPIASSELHVMVAATHCFQKGVIDTVVCDNIDPIEKIEMSTLLFASTVHGIPARELIKDRGELERLEGSMPLLLQEEIEDAAN